MSRPFNTHLRGWLGLLDAKVQGQAPASFEEAVRPTLDALPFVYAQLAQLFQGGTGGIGAAEGFFPDTTNNLLVPPGEMWYVAHFSGVSSAVLNAGESMQAALAFRNRLFLALGLNGIVTVSDRTPQINAGEMISLCAREPFWALPGDLLGLQVDRSVTAAAIPEVLLTARFVRIPI